MSVVILYRMDNLGTAQPTRFQMLKINSIDCFSGKFESPDSVHPIFGHTNSTPASAYALNTTMAIPALVS